MNPLKRVCSFILTLGLLCTLLPTAFALDTEWVLKSIGLTGATVTDGLSSASDRSVVMTVPYSTSASLNMAANLTYTKDTTIGAVSVSFSSDTGDVGDTVTLTVTYYKGSDTTTPYSTNYSITLTRAAKIDAAFGGSISKAATAIPGTAAGTIAFTAADFTNLYTANDGGALSAISITGSGLACGALKRQSGGSTIDYTEATQIDASDLSTLIFEGTGSGTVSYIVTAYDSTGIAVSGTVLLTVTFTAITVPTITGSITVSDVVGTAYKFTLADFTGACTMNSGTLQSVTITPSGTTYGTWSGPTGAFTTATTVSASSISSGQLVFTGTAAGSAAFTWTITSDAGTSASTGSGTVTVTAISAPTISGTVALSTTVSTLYTLKVSDFSSSYALHNGTLQSITVTPSGTTYGTFYYNSGAITSATTVTAAALAAGSLQFKGTAIGTASFTWSVTNEKATTSGGTGTITVAATTTTITYGTAAGTAVTFAASDFYAACYSATGYGLSYAYFSLPASTYGTLYYGYTSASSYTSLVSASTPYYYNSTSPYISYITFVPYSSYTGTVTLVYTGVSTAGTTYTGYIKVAVGASTSASVTYSTTASTPVTFAASDFYTACFSATGYGLSYVSFTLPSSSYGTLYYGYSSASSYTSLVTASTPYYYSAASPYLSYVTFVPTSGYTGTVTISYTGVTTAGASYSGYVKITVGSSTTVSYTTAASTAVTFSASDFYTACSSATGYGLSYVYFTLPSYSYGTLYYGYSSASSYTSVVSASTPYYYSASSPYLSYVTFVPYSGYTGTMTITYTGVTTAGSSYTGYVKITVGSSTTVSYTTAAGTPVTFAGSDFYTACSATTGYGLSYVTFSLPSSSYGTLYYGYSSASSYTSVVSSSTPYYYSASSPYLSYVTFVPYSGFTGSLTLSYTGVTTAGSSFTGYIKITVGSSSTVSYTTTGSTAVTFAAADFYSACSAATGYGLNYVYFTLPSSSYGTLYYGYASSGSYTSLVTASTPYYYSAASPYLSYVTFVPYSGYTGSLTFAYTGVTTAGTSYTGYVKITVSGSVSDLILTTDADTAVAVPASDFYSVCSSATGYGLNYVYFTLPSSSYGTLYYGYSSASSYSSVVTASTPYYYSASSPYLRQVSFVPASGFSGSLTITYTGVTTSGASYTGKLLIAVSTKNGSSYFSDVGTSYNWAASAIDGLYTLGVVTGTSADTFSPATSITRGDFILMLYRAYGFSGAPDTEFSDVPSSSYYAPAISAAKALGIAQGSGDQFNPSAPLTRQDAMLLIYRTLSTVGTSLSDGTTSDTAYYNDASQVSGYAETAVATLVKAGIIKGSGGLLNPTGKLTRAEMAVILYRALAL